MSMSFLIIQIRKIEIRKRPANIFKFSHGEYEECFELYIAKFFTYKGLPFVKVNFAQSMVAFELIEKGLLNKDEYAKTILRLSGNKCSAKNVFSHFNHQNDCAFTDESPEVRFFLIY